MNTTHNTLFVIIFIVLSLIVPRNAFGQMDHMKMPPKEHAKIQTPHKKHTPHSPPQTQTKKTPEQLEENKVRWSQEFLDQIKTFDQAGLLAKKHGNTVGEKIAAIKKMVALAKNTANAEKAYFIALDCKSPCEQVGREAFDKMTILAVQFSDVESILRITERSGSESPMIEPSAEQIKMAREKVIGLAVSKEQLRYILNRLPIGSPEETAALYKLNKFEESRPNNH